MPARGYKKRRARWDKTDVIAKIQEWNSRYGRPPAASEWNPSDCARYSRISVQRALQWTGRAERFKEGEWPWTATVWKLFGSWNVAIGEAGLDPRDSTKLDTPIPTVGIATLRGLLDRAEAAPEEDLPTTLLTLAARATAWASVLTNSQYEEQEHV